MTTILIAQFTKHGEWHAVTKPAWDILARVMGRLVPICHYPAEKPHSDVRMAYLDAQDGVHITCNWCRRKLGLPVLEKARRKVNAEVGSVPVPEPPTLAELVAPPEVTAADLERQLGRPAFARITYTTEDGTKHTDEVPLSDGERPRDPLADIMDRR